MPEWQRVPKIYIYIYVWRIWLISDSPLFLSTISLLWLKWLYILQPYSSTILQSFNPSEMVIPFLVRLSSGDNVLDHVGSIDLSPPPLDNTNGWSLKSCRDHRN